MVLIFFNTLTRTKEEFVPITKGKVSMYSCGPTVYNYAHIGNLRSFLFSDILKKYLKYKGYDVKHVMNITDVDDKTIRDSKKEGKTLKEFTEHYTKEFFNDFKTLNIEKPDIIPLATQTIPEMVGLVQKLIEKGIAYKGEDGTVYYNIRKFSDYGKLSNTKLEGLKSGARVCHDEYDKDCLSDFALWKAWDENDGDVFWETEIGKGRPGWHIECSAMSMKFLGESFDIHTGGIDLVFPHHENEIAQSEAATGKKFVNYWMHCEHLIVEGKKMSKSEGNFFTLRDLLDKGLNPKAIRYVLLATHYKQQLNFTFESVEAASNCIERINDFMLSLDNPKSKTDNSKVDEFLEKAKTDFEKNMDDNLNISPALAAIFELIKNINREGIENMSKNDTKKISDLMLKFNTVIGVIEKPDNELDEEISKMIEERESARNAKDYQKSDQIRDKLKEKGIILFDTPDGVKWKKA